MLAFISKFLVVVRIRMELEVSSFIFKKIILSSCLFFCYSWFRLQSIANHCNRRVCRQIHFTRDFFSTLSSLCTHHIACGSRCRTTCLHKKMFTHMSSHVRAFVVSLFCLLPLSLVPLLCLSLLPVCSLS